ncbi:MAG TPA: NAD(+) diphosphatase [Frankiaceae bacterium]|nr:NAD(+) diphosphatase [Frankiaceae bacterium]
MTAGAGHDRPAPLDQSPAPALSRATVYRAAERRTDDDWLADVWRNRGRLLVLDSNHQVLIADDRAAEDPELHLVPTDGGRADDAVFLGEDAEAAYFARRVDVLPVPEGTRAASLREVGSGLGDRDAGLLVHAVALLTWLSRSAHCTLCGALTEVRAAGSLRVCPVDGSEHHPRTDPAMIVLVTSPDGDRAVLGRNVGWPDGLYSCLAGFVEPGESAEQAVVREVAEEAGLAVTDLRYTGSQPWPFPSSLMLAYRAVTHEEDIKVDPVELSDARWFSRAELRTALADGSVWAPPSVSIARRLIDAWLDG